MSLNKIQEMVSSLAKKMDNAEKLAIPVLAAKINKSLLDNPHDQTLGSMSRVLEKMADNQNVFISRGEFNKLYKQLYSHGTIFGEIFENELGIKVTEPNVKYAEKVEGDVIGVYDGADPILSNALKSVFDKSLPVRIYSEDLASKAIASAMSVLSGFNLKPSNIKVAEGNEKFIVLQANYETPKGITSFYIPVEIVKGKVVEASIFMGNCAPQEINYKNVRSYVTTNAGAKLIVKSSVVLDVLEKSAEDGKEFSDAELALIKLKANRENKSEYFSNQILGQKADLVVKKDLEPVKFDTFASFEDEFDSVIGQAKWKFGKVVATGMQHLAREVIGFGYRNPQISVSKSDNSTIFYSVSLDGGTVAFMVPVKVADKKMVKPVVMICNGSVSDFSKGGIDKLYQNNQTDYKAAAVASPQFNLKPSELINNIKVAIAEKNYAKAEDALNVLANANDSKAYATGFQIYLNGLGNKEANVENKCSMQIKAANSLHVICGHTGLPLHKVYQDKHGNCCPGYRKDMNETYEGASFINAKIFG